MFLDALAQLADAQAVTDTDAYTTNTYDLGAATVARRVGTGERLSVVFVVTTAGAGDSASFTDTFDFIAVQSANANLSSHTAIIQRRVAGALLTVGAIIDVPLPAGMPTARYLGGRVELGSGDTITVDAYIMLSQQVQNFVAYAKGYAV